ncbi:hypothetical protein HRbin16_01184 [bacterium HR16]|nr:hypothetical protein HRbin16_01184 [bacterium HR16]
MQTHYLQWFDQIRDKRWQDAHVRVEFYEPMQAGPLPHGKAIGLPVTVCNEHSGCIEPLPIGASPVSPSVVMPLLVLAVITGLLMRRLRWVAGACAVAVLLSLFWCVTVALEETGQRPVRSYYEIQLQQVVDRIEENAESLSRISITSGLRPALSVQELGIRSDAERPQLIRQLAQLFRHHQRDYENAWQQWYSAGLLKQTWWVFRYKVLISWWSILVALFVVLAGGWLGILLGVWSWRLRSYLVYRYA